MGLVKSRDFEIFLLEEFVLFANSYKKIIHYSETLSSGFEYIFYNANRNFTLQPLLLLAAINKNDTKDEIDRKFRVVSCFLDQYISIRIFNYKTIDYSAMTYTMFMMAKRLRNRSAEELAELLIQEVKEMEFSLDGIDGFALNGWTKRYMLHQLARLTHFVEKESGRDTRFDTYVDRKIKYPYDIEHIWSDHYEEHLDEFESDEEFQRTRNLFGDLLILPLDINRSLNDDDYCKKKEKYFGQNLLAASLNELSYKNNPNFLRFFQKYELKFLPKPHFKKETIQSRQELYKSIAKVVWDVNKIKDQLSR